MKKAETMKLLNAGVGIWKLIARYPAVSAAIGNVLVVLGASLGLHFTVTQLTTTAAIVAGIFGVLVHAGVIPVTKVDNVHAGITPTIKGQASVLDTPSVEAVNAKPVIQPVNEIPPAVRSPFGNRE
jgi:hypothetical protein